MEIRVSISDSEADLLQRLARSWNVDVEEAVQCAIRSHYAAFVDLRFTPDSDLTPHKATELLLHAVWNEDGTFHMMRNGRDPGVVRNQQLATALTVLWFHFRKECSIPISVCHAAATIINFKTDAQHLAENRPDLTRELMDLNLRAYQLLSGAVADTDFT